MNTAGKFGLLMLSTLGVIGSALAADAQNYPTRPIRWIVPIPAGATADMITRLVAQKVNEAWGQQVIVDNRPGGAFVIGSDIVAKGNPDGHTVGTLLTPHIVNPFMLKNLPYDTLRDFTPVTLMVIVPGVMTMNPKVPRKTCGGDRARQSQTQFAQHYGSPGPTSGHLSMEMLKLTATNIQHVPHKGCAGDRAI